MLARAKRRFAVQVQNVAPVQFKEVIHFSEIATPFMRLIEIIREYSLYLFSLVASGVSLSPFKYMFSLAGPKKMISATLSLNLDRIAQLLPFEMWVPKIQFGLTLKLKKIGGQVD